ncbi:MAG: hypothetical protein ACE5FT_06515 [Candidatus Nanoarchaeia archaeon]
MLPLRHDKCHLEKANDGGHIPAAGGSVLKKDMPVFKERVLKYLKDHPPE